jgi:outer membrane immunogenic protein
MIPAVGLKAGLPGIISMRRIIAATAAFLTATFPSFAADMGGPPAVLRGAIPADTSIDWSGFYVGGMGTYTTMSLNRNRGQGQVDPLLSRLVRGTIVETGVIAMPLVEQGRYQTNAMGFGAFAGYNWTADGAVFGVEVDYSRTTLKNEINGARSGMVTGGTPQTTYEWNASTYKRSKLTEFGTIRARLGYAYGNLMPFLTGGMAIGRSSEANYAAINGVQWPTSEGGACSAAPSCAPTFYNPPSLSESNRAKVQLGYTLGIGFDYAFTNNIFVRAEYQHVRFPEIASTSAQINQARVGAGVKF